MKNKFTIEQINDYLQQHFHTKANTEIATAIGYSVRQISVFAQKIGLKKGKRIKAQMTESQYNVIKNALETAKEKNAVSKIAQSVGVCQKLFSKMRTKILITKDFAEFCIVTAKTSTKLLTESQYNEVKRAIRAGETLAEINAVAKSVGLSKSFYRNNRESLTKSNTYQEFADLIANSPKKKAREQAREQKAIRENTAKVNAEILKKRKPKNKPNKAVNSKKAGQTTRAIKALLEEEEKAKALKEYTEKLNAEINAQDQNQLSVNIRVQVGKTHYILQRAKYDTPEKIEEFKKKKALQEQQHIEKVNQILKKPSQEY